MHQQARPNPAPPISGQDAVRQCPTPPPVYGELAARLTDAGDASPRVMLRYRMHGPAGAPVVVAMGGISADREVDRWWRDLYGRGRGLDPGAHRLVSMDWPAGFRAGGAAVTTRQQARALACVLDRLGIGRAAVLVGASYGAMVGLAFAAHYGDRVDRLVAISGAHRAHPMATARRHLQREIVRFGLKAKQPVQALVLARALAMTTYRPAALFAERFTRPRPEQTLAAIAGYLRHTGEAFCEHFDPHRYLCLSESMDVHCVDPKRVHCPVDLVAVDSDELVPVWQLRSLTGAIGLHCRLHEIRSAYGHDAFLKEPDQFNEILGRVVHGEGTYALV